MKKKIMMLLIMFISGMFLCTTVFANTITESEDNGSSGGSSSGNVGTGSEESGVIIPTESEDDSSGGSSSNSDYILTLIFKDSSGNFVSGVEYNITNSSNTGKCDGTIIKEGKSGNDYIMYVFPSNTYVCVSIQSVPKGYIEAKPQYLKLQQNKTMTFELGQEGILKLGFKNSSGNMISGVKYSFYKNSSCSGTAIKTGTSSTTYKEHPFDATGTYYIKTTYVPSGYEALACRMITIKATSPGTLLTLNEIKMDEEENNNQNPSTGSENEEENNNQNPDADAIEGTIKINVVDKETGKALSDVGVQVCKTETCDGNDEKYAFTVASKELKVEYGTYYIVVSSVPNGYEKPETIKITVDKENPISTTKLEVLKQTKVPNTLSNVSKTFIICGLIGMIAGISLLYFNAKKQEEI